MTEQTDIKSLSLLELESRLKDLAEPKYRAKQVYKWLHEGARSFDEMTNIPEYLREKLDEKYFITVPEIEAKQVSEIDDTIKYLWRLRDGNCVETVLMSYNHGNTVCVSTQVGCRMGCKFCASTIGGLVRNLEPSEILDQALFAQIDSGRRISNIVLMGIGEPLDNYDNVTKFLRLVNSADGMNIGMRHISVSTCGLVEEIAKLAEENIQVTLSVSLHSPDDETRSAIMPVNRIYGVERLLSACKEYFEKTGRRVSYEYTMIDGVSDKPEQAEQLAELLKGTPAHVNLIALNNVTENELRPSSSLSISAFRRRLEKDGITVTLRRSLGADIDASCGQLRRKTIGPIMRAWGKTDKGLVRAQNQDTFAIGSVEGGMFCVVCDGMGGAAAGDIASKLAIDTFVSAYKKAKVGHSLEEALLIASERANDAVYDRSLIEYTYFGMGTTLVALCSDGKTAVVGNIGDSRAYRISDRKISKITRDHSFVETLVNMGDITPDEAKTHPRRNVITRSLGTEPFVKCDTYNVDFRKGDVILLCSDGLSNLVDDNELLAVILEAGNRDICCDRLVELAKQRGAPDNVTVVITEF